MSLRLRLYTRLFAVGCFFHLTLPDAHQWSWLVPNILLGGGAAWLLVKPPTGRFAFAPWVLCGLGALGPLLFAGDQLTQSVFLVVQCVLMLSAWRTPERAAAAIRTCTVAFYAIAAFHKLNADFFDPEVSCAVGGVRLLGENWSVVLPDLGAAWPILFIVVELGIAVAWVLRPALGVIVASAMHLPLTIVFAPAFAWVMIPAWVWFFDDEDLAHYVSVFRDKRVIGIGLVLGAVSMAFYFRDHWIPYPFWQLNELALWIVVVASARAWWVRADRLKGRGAWGDSPIGWRGLVLVAMVVNASTPYLGLQFHHAGAMLSNLRIDKGCWNHLLVPESARIRDPYVRVNGHPELESTLWHPAQLRDWLEEHCEGPILVTVDDEEVDACQLELAGRHGLFQTNLERNCPQRCIH